jgi:hypothetical protein
MVTSLKPGLPRGNQRIGGTQNPGVEMMRRLRNQNPFWIMFLIFPNGFLLCVLCHEISFWVEAFWGASLAHAGFVSRPC